MSDRSTEVETLVSEFTAVAASALAEFGAADFRSQWRVLGKRGFLGSSPRGGPSGPSGIGPVTRTVAMVEGLGLAGAKAGLCYAVASQHFGLQFPLRELLGGEIGPRLGDVAGGGVVLCHALTEEGGGSDPLSMRTRAERQEDGGYLLSGKKSFITAAPVADTALVFARTLPDRSPFALSPFLVDLTLPGVRRSAPLPKTALVEVPMGELEFDGVRLAPDCLLSGEGSGLAVLSATTSWERALLLAYALGPMRRVLDRTVDWCRSREHFGRKMGSSHLVAGRVSDMALALHRSRTLLYAIAGRLDDGAGPRRLAADAALTKISVAEDYVMFTERAAMLGGVRSYIEDSGLTADLAGPMAASTYAGPNDLLRVSVAHELGLPVEN